MCRVGTKKSEIQRCNDFLCWKQGKKPLRMELPADLVHELKVKAKKAGMEYDQFISLVFEDGVKKKIKFDEMVRKKVRRVLLEEVERIAPHTRKVLAKLLMTKKEKILPN